MPRSIPARPPVKPKMYDRVTAWQYAFGIIVSTTMDTSNEVPPGYAAIAAAILTVGNVDVQDPMLQSVVELMSNPKAPATQHEGENNGNGS